MEIKQRMSNRFAWLLGVVVLMAIGFLVACGSNYSTSNDGLVLTTSQGAAALQTFSFDLASGHTSAIYNPPSSTASSTCILPGVPSSIVLDPTGAFAYAVITANSACTSSQTGIMGFKVNSDGTMTAAGSTVADASPVALAMDSSGKFLFVAEGLAGGVNVYGVSSGSLTAVAGTFKFPATAVAPNLVAVAATPTVFPALTAAGTSNSVCSSQPAPTAEYLYAADAANNMVWEFSVDTSTGALGNPASTTTVPNYVTGSVPGGVTVDACNRFVYVSNQNSNNVSAYTICNGSTTQSSTCTASDGSLKEISGSPFSLSGGANGPGPLLVDPFGNYLYIVDTLSNQLSALHISPVSGSLTDLSPAVVTTGTQPKSIAIRSDDSWIFVANFASATLSQYAVTPASGALTPQTGITTDNYPWGVAVK
jgi:6-phosphogluconolactonase (cycloisomerase 2 family)